MTFNRANLDRYLMGTFLGLLMIVAGMSSTDKWWIAIGGIILAITFLSVAIDIYGWTQRSKDDRGLPSKLRVALMFPLCLLLAAGSFWLGGTEGVIMAALLVLTYSALLFLTFTADTPVKLFSMTVTSPVLSGHADARKLFEAINSQPDKAQEILAEHLAEHPVVPDNGLWRALDAISGGRLQQSLEEAGKTTTVQRTPDGFVMKQDIQIAVEPPDDMVETVLSVLRGRTQSPTQRKAAGPVDAQTARSLLAQGDDFRARGLNAEAREAYEKAEAHAVVDWANKQTNDRSVLPTVLIRLGKPDAARALISEALASTPDDEKLLAAQALLEQETK
jgi:hypothetical protein